MPYTVWAKTRGGITQVAATKTREDAKLVMQNWDTCYIAHNGDILDLKNWV